MREKTEAVLSLNIIMKVPICMVKALSFTFGLSMAISMFLIVFGLNTTPYKGQQSLETELQMNGCLYVKGPLA